jgi:Abortive infection C-terminus
MAKRSVHGEIIDVVAAAFSTWYAESTFETLASQFHDERDVGKTKVERWRNAFDRLVVSGPDGVATFWYLVNRFVQMKLPGNSPSRRVFSSDKAAIHAVVKKCGYSSELRPQNRSRVAIATIDFQKRLRRLDLPTVDREFDRAKRHVEIDPALALSAASNILEAIFKNYIAKANLQLPQKQTIHELWAVVRTHIERELDPLSKEDVQRIGTGLTSLVESIGSLRTHVSSAHGRGPGTVQPKPRHARLALHSAHTLGSFIVETWNVERKGVQTESGPF